MNISCLWLKELVDFALSPEELAATLTGLGLETALRDDRRGWYKNIVAGKVLEVTAHPNADKLRLTRVDVGPLGVKRIVCGAPNVAAGQLVPVALIGAVLPDGLKIEPRKVRGEMSEGMICSEAELKLSGGHDGIMVLEGDIKPGTPFSDAFEVCDTVLEIDLTPNRGDCLSMIGIAREVAAATGGSVKRPSAQIAESSDPASSKISVQIASPELCPRYAGRMITGVKVGKTPFWMRRRLSALGVRSINNIVDVTNYILMETGHPLHAFDHQNLEGAKIVVRRAAEGEKFTTLDGKSHTLTKDNLLIADANRGVALAGIMGGQNSEVTAGTTQIMLEAAYFDPACIRRTARALSISSESSYRFERGTDVDGLIYAQDRAAKLIAQTGGGAVMMGRVDAYPKPIARRSVTLRFARLNKILGISVDADEAAGILNRLEMPAEKRDAASVTVSVPYARSDIEREIDLIEEVARHIGYDRIIPSIPQVAVSEDGVSRGLTERMFVRNHLRSLGMMEGFRLSFINMESLDKLYLPADHGARAAAPLDNPLSSEWTHLRTTLIPGMVSSMRGADDAKIFEIGKVFISRGHQAAPLEWWSLCGAVTEAIKPGLYSGRAGKRDFGDIKGIVESVMDALGHGADTRFVPSGHPFYYPKRQADVSVGDQVVGHFGQVHPDTLEAYEISGELFVFELNLDAIAIIGPGVKKFAQLPKFPPVKRDLAVVVDEKVTLARLIEVIRAHGGAGIAGVTPFDIYRGEKLGEGKKSVAFSLEMRAAGRTLTDEEADKVFGAIVAGLEKDCAAKLR
ncbi:MAG: phenylalanine--tRNA ligase subunit beta [Nitrospinae bacterium]|nr:phenylalanine--tRNA ligase subunit beta [Nitrospinota bacterium]